MPWPLIIAAYLVVAAVAALAMYRCIRASKFRKDDPDKLYFRKKFTDAFEQDDEETHG